MSIEPPWPSWWSPTATRKKKNHRKNAFDVGEGGIGSLANSLTLGCDCLGQIYYFDVSP